MVHFYVMRIRMDKMTLADVPPRWRTAVEAELNQ